MLIKLSYFGGGKRDRTADLLHAMQALSQLSYTPVPTSFSLLVTELSARRHNKDGPDACQLLFTDFLPNVLLNLL